ncbi:uncharacterized protein LOC124941899 isoform X3 [Impatiens glandulifera]|uniref:uncharacterized protein LOC124941899 isoform X3 n=1 Tax=Impatiens glandulifera TaxID=253017 RepID=UPI001FB0BF7A|nr:uncharacterized protein LOC124941899 isoform X3 [Impatiens glandulifera]
MKCKQGKGKRKPRPSRASTSKVNQVVQDIASFYNGGNSDLEQSGGVQISSRMEGETPRKDNTQSNPLADFGRVALANARMGDNMRSFPAPSVSANFSKNSKSSVKKSTKGVASSSMRPCNDDVNRTRTERSPAPPRQSRSSHSGVPYKDRELKVALEVIRKIMETDAAVPFNIPVDDTDVPDYYDIIDTPMDFSTIRRNLDAGVVYKNSKDVFHDVEYIWNNCYKYNKKGSFIVELGNRVKKNFSKLWAEAGLDGKLVDDIINVIAEPMTMHNKHVPQAQIQLGPVINCISHQQQPEQSTDQNHFQPITDNNRCRNDFAPPAQPESMNRSPKVRTSLRASLKKRTPKSKASMPAGVGPMIDNHHQQDNQKVSCKPNVGLDSATSPPMASSARTARQESRHRADHVDYNSLHNTPHVNTVERASHNLFVNYRQPQSFIPSPVPNGGTEVDSASSPPMASSARTARQESRHRADPVDNNSLHSTPHVNTVERSSHNLLVNYRQPQTSIPSPVPNGGTEVSPLNKSSSNCMKKRGRGPTKCLQLWNSITKITVVVDEFGHPIGNEAPKLINFLGTIARNGHIAPLNYIDWRALPDENKEKMWEQVQSRFDIDPQCKDWIIKSLGKKWKDWKAQLKIHHYSVHDNDKDRLEDCDERVLPDQWKILVSFWNSDEAKERSMKAKASRAHQKINHTSGTKSFARIREEQRSKMPDRKPPSRADLFIMTRTRKDGRPINDDSSKLISELREHAAQQEGTSKDGGIEDDIFSKVMGNDRHGRPRTYGLGPATSEVTIVAKDTNHEVVEARKEVREIKERLATMEQSHAQITAQMMAQMTEILSRMPVTNKKGPEHEHIANKKGPEDEHVANAVILASDPVPIERVDVSPIISNESSSKEVYQLSSQRSTTRKRGIPQTQRTTTKRVNCFCFQKSYSLHSFLFKFFIE